MLKLGTQHTHQGQHVDGAGNAEEKGGRGGWGSHGELMLMLAAIFDFELATAANTKQTRRRGRDLSSMPIQVQQLLQQAQQAFDCKLLFASQSLTTRVGDCSKSVESLKLQHESTVQLANLLQQ